MNAKMNVNKDFVWEKLLELIKMKKIIPVVGHGLYRVHVKSDGKTNCLLYDYLAEKVLKESGTSLKFKENENHKFAKACFEVLKKNGNNYFNLSHFLKKVLKEVTLVPDSSLLKLARIKNFNIFINTTYDDFLIRSIKTVRSVPTKAFNYTSKDRNFGSFDYEWFTSLDQLKCTLIFNIFGTINKSLKPAYTEKDILETIVDFQEDIFINNGNNMIMKLKGSILLFIGCGYNDWLFRFFIRTTANRPYEFHDEGQPYNFVGDACYDGFKYPFKELPTFLKNYKTELFHSSDGTDFVDLLFKQIEKDSSDQIIQPIDCPGKVFISFIGADRAIAGKFAQNLKDDGIYVWLDENKLKGGDDVDEEISRAIDKSSVFIPLISHISQKTKTKDGKIAYHLREWDWAYKNTKSVESNLTIIPVIIDDSELKYNDFIHLYYFRILGGERTGKYNKLLDQLEEILKKQNEVE